MVLSVKEFCQYAGISPALYYLLQKRGEGPAETRIAGRVLILKETAAAWLRSKEVPAKVAA